MLIDHLIELLIFSADAFLLPLLVKYAASVVESKLIWINDTSDKELYSRLKHPLFIGLHQKLLSPIVLNYHSRIEAAEIGFELTAAWACFKQWISEDRMLLAGSKENPRLASGYRMDFNRSMQLVDTNLDKPEEARQYFSFPGMIESFTDLELEKVLKSKEHSELICEVLSELIVKKETQFYLSQPSMVLRVATAGERISGFSLLVNAEVAGGGAHTEVSLEAIQYAMTPLSYIKHIDTEWEESVFQENMPLLLSKESLIIPPGGRSQKKYSDIKNSSASASCLHQLAAKSGNGRPQLTVHALKSQKAGTTTQKEVNARAKNLMKMRSQFSQQASVNFDRQEEDRGHYFGRSTSRASLQEQDISSGFKDAMKSFEKEIRHSIAREYTIRREGFDQDNSPTLPKNNRSSMILSMTDKEVDSYWVSEDSMRKKLKAKEKSSVIFTRIHSAIPAPKTDA